MRAVVLRAFGGPEQLVHEELDDPVPGPGEVRVRVEAVAVVRTKDVSARAGRPPFGGIIALPHVLGAECAGVVDQVGPGGDGSLLGARVAVSAVLSCGRCRACTAHHEEACSSFSLIGVHHQGSYAELLLAPVGNVHRVPDGVDALQAAALAANGPVARAQLDAGGVEEGSTVVVEHLARKRDVLADRGRIVVSGAIGREPIPVALLGLYLRSQSPIGVRTGNRAQVAALWEDVRDGFRLPGPLVTARAWEDVALAHADVEECRAVGQLVLTLG